MNAAESLSDSREDLSGPDSSSPHAREHTPSGLKRDSDHVHIHDPTGEAETTARGRPLSAGAREVNEGMDQDGLLIGVSHWNNETASRLLESRKWSGAGGGPESDSVPPGERPLPSGDESAPACLHMALCLSLPPMLRPVLFLSLLVAFAGCVTADSDGPDRPSNYALSQDDFEQRLSAQGYFLSSRGLPSNPIIRAQASGREFTLSGPGRGVLQVYTFDSAAEAEQAVRRRIDLNGFSTLAVYQSGPLVVGYYGDDFTVRSDLSRILGRPRR